MENNQLSKTNTYYVIRVGDRYWKDSTGDNAYPWTFDIHEAFAWKNKSKAQAVVDYWNKVHYHKTIKLPNGREIQDWSGISGHNCMNGVIEEWQITYDKIGE